MFGLEKYKDAFGPAGLRTGLRKYRILGISIFDVVVVMVCCVFLSWILRLQYWLTLVIVLVIGIIIHRLVGARTTIDKFLFPNL